MQKSLELASGDCRVARGTMLAVALAATLASCSTVPRDAQTKLVGLSDADLKTCAGLPTRTETVDKDTKIYSYDYDAGTPGLNFSLVFAQLNLTGKKYCSAIFKIRHGKIVQLTYAGATDFVGRDDRVCEPIVSHCLSSPVGSAPSLH